MAGNFVFDIDGAMAILIGHEVERREGEVRERFGQAFLDRHCLTACKHPHFIYPGYYALFRWLRDRGGKLFFFSSGLEERNVELAEKMIARAFGPDKDKVEYQVFSRQHCIDTHALKWKDPEVDDKYQSIVYGQRKKKLGGIVVPEKDLPNTLLIDDDISYITKGEEYNFVNLPYSYEYMPRDKEGEGFRQFHKAYYLAGLFDKILEVQTTRDLTLVDAAKHVQVELEGREMGDKFYFSSIDRVVYYERGLALLQEIEPELKFYVDKPEGETLR